MDVLFLKNPKTGEVRRLWSTAIIPAELGVFEDWVAVDWKAWVDANTDMMPVLSAPQLEATAPTAAALEAYPDLYRSGDYSVYYDPDYQEYIVASGGGDPLSARKTLDEAKAIADAYASEGDKAAPTAAAQGEGVPASVDDLSPAQKEVWVRLALNQADVQIAALEAALQQAQRERDAYAVALNAVFVNVEPALIEVAGIHEENMPSDKRALFRVFRIVDGVLQASAQQAALPADGEG